MQINATGQQDVRFVNTGKLYLQLKGDRYFNTVFLKVKGKFSAEGEILVKEAIEEIEALSTPKGKLTEAHRDHLELKLSKAEKRILDFEERMNEEIKDVRERFRNYKLKKIKKIIQTYKIEQNIDLVFDTSYLKYFDEERLIDEEIIEIINDLKEEDITKELKVLFKDIEEKFN